MRELADFANFWLIVIVAVTLIGGVWTWLEEWLAELRKTKRRR
jgi:hypothetical protein